MPIQYYFLDWKQIRQVSFIFCFRSHPRNQHVLQCIELLVRQNIYDIRDYLQQQVYDVIKCNLTAPENLKRLLTLKILNNIAKESNHQVKSNLHGLL